MPFCSNCGNEIDANAKFCHNCGKNISTKPTEDTSKRKQEYAGTIIKCPACGEEIPSLTAICPACGHEINSAKVSESLSNFISQIEECDRRIANSPDAPKKGWTSWNTGKRVGWVILNLLFAFIPMVIYFLRPLFKTDKAPSLTKEEKLKATVIENFAFPNERESIIEALLFINSKVALLATEKANSNNAYWTRLWIKKSEGLHHKAEMMFPGDRIVANAYSETIENGTKIKKALKVRLVIAVVLLVVFVIFVGVKRGAFDDIVRSTTTLEIPDTELSQVLPLIEGGKGDVVTNNSTYFSIEYYGISDSEFENYKSLCKEQGYTIDGQSTGSLYDAFNEDGYNIRVTYFSSELHITITDVQEMRTIIWPESDIANLLPTPESDYGSIESSSDSCIIMYIGNTPHESYNSYVDACIRNGFNSDMVRQDDHYHADNAEDFSVTVEYRGFNTMFIRIDNP